MKAAIRSRWDKRRFVSLCALFSGLALPVTGVADHLARHTSDGPHASPGWIVAHIGMSALFVVFAAWHGWLNRGALLRYLRGRMPHAPLPSREALAALALVGAIMVALVVHAVSGS